MLNFTVGPVMSGETVLEIGKEQVPYFRTAEFSAVMLENERLMLKFSKAPEGSKVVFITGSGTASMEAAVINTLSPQDKVIVVNGGSFGHRFVQLCEIHGVPYSEINLEAGHALSADMLKPYENQGYTAFLINVHETSTGVRYDMDMVGTFCRENGLFLIADAISSFIADPFDMDGYGVDIMLTGSQKALACPPGVSIMVLSPRAVERIHSHDARCMYFDLKEALKNAERGQTPFTPAVGILLQINARLREIEAAGGIETETAKVAALAEDFRSKIVHFPFEMISQSPSNAVTALHPRNVSANDIFLALKDEYGIWICPNGGEMKHTVFRVGHIGALSTEDNDCLINALKDMQSKGML